VAKWVMRDRQNLGLLRVRDGVIAVERMHFADEIRSPEGLAPSDAEVNKQELEMAAQLIEQFKGDFNPDEYRDTYRDALCEIIKAKRKGEEIRVEAEPEPEAPTDLMEALRSSVEAARRNRAPGRSSNGDLESRSKDELYKLAQDADIPGRSDMTKEELVEALRAA
jgi:DNA end-binding protein Ku